MRSAPIGLVRLVALLVMVVLSAGLGAGRAAAQGAPRAETVPAVLLSDLHFDPFHDPAKTALLVQAPVKQWDAILDAGILRIRPRNLPPCRKRARRSN